MSNAIEMGSQIGRPEIVDPRRRYIGLLATMVFVLAGLGVSVWAFADTLDGGEAIVLPTLEVPKVESINIDEARRQLEADGFAVQVQFQPNEIEPKGVVLGQRPLAGTKVEQGELIVVLASDGPLGRAVPSISSQLSFDAVAALSAAGLGSEIVLTPSETIRVDEVIGTVPSAGERVPADGVIKVLVSSGPSPRLVPPLLLRPLQPSLAEIGRSGLAVGKLTYVYKPDVPPGLILESDPVEATPLPRDTPVSLTVSGAEPSAVVPYLIGLQRASAELVAQSADLNVKVRAFPVAPGDPLAGRVVGQGTPPLAEVPAGWTIEITVAVVQQPVVQKPAVTVEE